MTSDTITVAQLGGAFGVKGELRLKSFCATPEDIADYGPFQLDNGQTIQTLVLTGQIKGGFSARLDGVITKEDADALKGQKLNVPRSALPSLPDDEFYYSDLVGLTVLDTGGTTIGTVKAVQNHGAGDLLEIIAKGASSTLLLPFTKDAIPTVDLATGRIIADPPGGILGPQD